MAMLMATGLSHAQTVHFNGEKATPLHTMTHTSVAARLLRPARQAALPAPRRAAERAITTQPEGRLVQYQRTGWGFYYDGEDVDYARLDGTVARMVYADDGRTVYIEDIVGWFDYGTWVKGTLMDDGRTLQVPVGQSVMDFVDEDGDVVYSYQLARMAYSASEQTYMVDYSTMFFTFTIADDGTITLQGDEGGTSSYYAMGLYDTEEGWWAGFCDWNVVFKPFDEQPVSTPADLVTEDFQLSVRDADGQVYSDIVKVGFLGDDVYVQGLCSYLPYTWVKGTNHGSYITFDSGQYLGQLYNYYAYFVTAIYTKRSSGGQTYYDYSFINRIRFTFDTETRTMTSGDAYIVNRGSERRQYVATYPNPQMQIFREVAATPATPRVLAYQPYQYRPGSSANYGYVRFELPVSSVDGDFINPYKLSYQVFVDDDEVFTFYNDEYRWIDETTDELPYLYTDGADIARGGQQVNLYQAGFDRIGVQTIYRGAGEERRSQRVYLNINTEGIAGVAADSSTTPCYDLQGRRVDTDRLQHGLYISGGRKQLR